MSDTKKEPVARISLYPITAKIWRNEGKDGDVFYAATFERRYRDKEGNWKGGSSFVYEELLLLAKIADFAHTEIANLKNADRTTQQPPDFEVSTV